MHWMDRPHQTRSVPSDSSLLRAGSVADTSIASLGTHGRSIGPASLQSLPGHTDGWLRLWPMRRQIRPCLPGEHIQSVRNKPEGNIPGLYSSSVPRRKNRRRSRPRMIAKKLLSGAKKFFTANSSAFLEERSMGQVTRRGCSGSQKKSSRTEPPSALAYSLKACRIRDEP